MTTTPVRAVYAHVPFCQTICGYCDFYSIVYDERGVSPLVESLIRELVQSTARVQCAIETIFVGGGTPTTLPPAELERLLTALRNAAKPGAAQPEFTVEANPATVTPEKAAVLAKSGVTRVSIGAQSFDTSELRVLDRIHRPLQVAETLSICRNAGIPQANLDLIFAVPGQSLDAWLRNLHAAIELAPDHLSCYGLTYEKGTPLFEQLLAGQVKRIDTDREAEMYEATIETLAGAGYEQYEISNFARPGCECRHNLIYWRNEPYLGIGPSAAGFVDGVRYQNVPDAAEYGRAVMAGRSARVTEERLSENQRARETVMLELRLNRGIDRPAFAARFGHDPTQLFSAAVSKHQSLGLLDVTEDAVRLTNRGRLVADAVISDFL